MGEADLGEQVGGAPASGAAGGAGQVAGQLDVLEGVEGREEIEVLEDEPEVVGAQRGSERSAAVATSVPSMVMDPEVGRSIAPSMSRRVVLPLPEGPMMSTTSPASRSRSTWRTASTARSPCPYVLVRSWTDTTVMTPSGRSTPGR
jgi:hypothetical protein